MSVATETKPRKKQEEAPPRELNPHEIAFRDVQVGDDIWWYDGAEPSEKPHFGKCSAKGMVNICVNLIQPNCHVFKVKEGVPHMSDPRAKLDPSTGGWDFAPRTKQMMELAALLPELKRLLS